MNSDSRAPAPSIIPSHLDDTAKLSSLPVQLDLSNVGETYSTQIDGILANWRATCYLATSQIFLQSDTLGAEKLSKNDVKPRLLGHFGTTAGLALAHTQTSALISRRAKENDEFIFVLGGGHGAPAILSALFIEGSITHFDPQYDDKSAAGVSSFVKSFSWPGGFPSHVNSSTPGAIHEGGELGYALAVAYGSVMDSPNLIAIAMIGDGESETGPTAAAWHSHKFIDPKESGAVLPILHLNGFKISERTIPGTMDTIELSLLYAGYGYQVRFVEYGGVDGYHKGGNDPADREIHLNFAASIDWAYDEIRKIQAAARSGKPIDKPRWPLIILRSPKGWTGPSRTNGKHSTQLLNNFASHQVPLPLAKTDQEQFDLLSRWLASYEPQKIFKSSHDHDNKSSIFHDLVTSILPPRSDQRLGRARSAYANYRPLELSDWKAIPYEKGSDASATKAIAKYLTETIKRNPTSFRIFSPDELASNKLDGVFEVTTRNFQPDPDTAHIGGRVIEMLSEHSLQGFMQGYTLTGRHAVFPSYEAFLGIVSTMLTQYSKFTKIAAETHWRQDVASLTYLASSTWTRQEHNGFSHQSPAFISTVLALPTHLARVYFPADANMATSVIAHCLRSKNLVNLIIGSKADTQVFLSVEEANAHCIAGASVWEKFSIDNGVNPDIVLVGIGVELTQEIIACADLLRKDFPDLRVRVVNVVDLLIFAPVGEHPHALNEASFNSLFPPCTPIVINFHGTPSQLQSLLFNRPHSVGRSRFAISGYAEEGTTTTPWSMLRLNGCGRFDLAAKALEMVATNFTSDRLSPDHQDTAAAQHRLGKVVARAHLMISTYLHQNVVLKEHSDETQMDHPDLAKIWESK